MVGYVHGLITGEQQQPEPDSSVTRALDSVIQGY